jgi:chemotaxis protein methyltransferase CheR
MDNWSLPHNMDIIFCRNVMIYFNKATQKMLIDKFAKVQSVGSKLVIGHSENIGIENSQYKLIGKTIYERV